MAAEPKGRNGEESRGGARGGGGGEEEEEEEDEEVEGVEFDAEGDVAAAACLGLNDGLARRVVGTLFVFRAPGATRKPRISASAYGLITATERRESPRFRTQMRKKERNGAKPLARLASHSSEM